MKNETAVGRDDAQLYLFGAIIATIMSVLVICVIFFMRKKIQLVIQLIKEAGKAIASMPLILFEPVLVSRLINMGVLIIMINFVDTFVFGVQYT